jgi:hypothetical protein
MNVDGKLQTGLDNMKIQLGKIAKQVPFHEHSLLALHFQGSTLALA